VKKLVNYFLNIYRNDKVAFFLFLTVIINFGSFVFKFTMGILIPNTWFLINSLFYFVSLLARTVSIKSYLKVHTATDTATKNYISYKNYFNNGLLLIVLGFIYFGVSAYMFLQQTIHGIKGHMVYAVSFQAFLLLGISIYGMIKYKRNHSPIMAAVKNTNFCNALTSIVLTQVVLLDNFGEGENYQIFNGITGIVASVIIIILGVFMTNGIQLIMRKEGYEYD